MSQRNRSHDLYVQGGVRLDHLADVILARYPDARLTENMVNLDLGVPKPKPVLEPLTEAESGVNWGIDTWFQHMRGVSPKVDSLLDALATDPDLAQLRASRLRKIKANDRAAGKAAKFEDDERNELQRLLSQGPPSR